MAITELGACEWFVWDLRRSNLIDRGHLDQLINEFLKKQPTAEPPALAQFLVGQGILSHFQAERLLQGKTQGLVLGPYTLIDALGSGSMGTVYKALSKTDNKWYAVNRVAILIFNPDAGVTLLLQKAGSVVANGPAIGIIYPTTSLRVDASGNYCLQLGGANINAVVSEIYNAVVNPLP